MKTVFSPELIIGGDNVIYGLNKVVNPKNDSKFSPNLYKFLTYRKKFYTNVFQDSETGIYYIGILEPNGWFCGSKLMAVFCYGSQAGTFAYAPKDTSTFLDVTKWFWSEYFKEGKAIYDRKDFRSIDKSRCNTGVVKP